MPSMRRSASAAARYGRQMNALRQSQAEAAQPYTVHFVNKDGSRRGTATSHHPTEEHAREAAERMAGYNPKKSVQVIRKETGEIAHTAHGNESPHKEVKPATQLSAFAEQGGGGTAPPTAPPPSSVAAASPQAAVDAPTGRAPKLKAFAEETQKKEEKAAAPMAGLMFTKHGTAYRIGPSGRRIYVKAK